MQLTGKRLATILAALRHWQRTMSMNEGGSFNDAIPGMCHFLEHDPLDEKEIDQLCEDLNTDPGTVAVAVISRRTSDPVVMIGDPDGVEEELLGYVEQNWHLIEDFEDVPPMETLDRDERIEYYFQISGVEMGCDYITVNEAESKLIPKPE